MINPMKLALTNNWPRRVEVHVGFGPRGANGKKTSTVPTHASGNGPTLRLECSSRDAEFGRRRAHLPIFSSPPAWACVYSSRERGLGKVARSDFDAAFNRSLRGTFDAGASGA